VIGADRRGDTDRQKNEANALVVTTFAAMGGATSGIGGPAVAALLWHRPMDERPSHRNLLWAPIMYAMKKTLHDVAFEKRESIKRIVCLCAATEDTFLGKKSIPQVAVVHSQVSSWPASWDPSSL
jgi:hypothetical protein